MELSKKTTILFSPEQHRQLSAQAASQGVSLGELVREACLVAYGVVDQNSRRAAVRGLADLSLPVGSSAAMKREAQPDPERLLP